MANKNKKQERRQEQIRREKEKKFEALCGKLYLFPCIVAGLLVLTLLLFFITWAEIYNTDIAGAEVSISGWNCFISGITGNYTAAEGVLGDMAVPFYYYAESYCESLSIITVIVFFIVLLSIGIQAVAVFKKIHWLNFISVFLNFMIALLLIVCFSIALSMNGSKILPIYCSGNPACSIHSFAIIPAIVAFVATALSVVPSVKYFKALDLLK